MKSSSRLKLATTLGILWCSTYHVIFFSRRLGSFDAVFATSSRTGRFKPKMLQTSIFLNDSFAVSTEHSRRLRPSFSNSNRLLDGKNGREEECRPRSDWYYDSYPTCNSIHEISHLEKLLRTHHAAAMLGQGMSSIGWTIWDEITESQVVFRTHRYDADADSRYMKLGAERVYTKQRIDAIVSEKLTSSPHVIDTYGFCGLSAIAEYADGGRLSDFVEKGGAASTKQMYTFVKDAMQGTADIHSIDGEHATVRHRDASLKNMGLFSNGDGTYRLKLFDFNSPVFLEWNFRDNVSCGWKRQVGWARAMPDCGGLWARAPEACLNVTSLPLDYPNEKTDVYK